jgi:hypothetical protein
MEEENEIYTGKQKKNHWREYGPKIGSYYRMLQTCNIEDTEYKRWGYTAGWVTESPSNLQIE